MLWRLSRLLVVNLMVGIPLLVSCKNSFIVTSKEDDNKRNSCNESAAATASSGCIKEKTSAKPPKVADGPPSVPETPDTTPPSVAETFLSLTAVELIDGKITVQWNSASDNVSSAKTLSYDLYYSELPDIETLSDIKANGTKAGTVKGDVSFQISDLTIDKDYFFNVIVKDAAGNEAAYAMRSPFCGGSGVTGDEYEVCDAGSLQYVSRHPSSNFVQTKDIDLTGSKNWNGGSGFTSIGSASFTGVFDGQNFRISNLYNEGVGLFEYVYGAGATLKNVRLESARIIATNQNFGILVGTVSTGALISNCHASGYIESPASRPNGGGLVGNLHNSSIVEDSSATTEIRTDSLDVGGLIGTSNTVGGVSDNRVSRSFAGGYITGLMYVGGLIGRARHTEIEDVYATANVASTVGLSSYTGGLFGYLSGTLTRAYATGHVTGESVVGGLIGTGATQSNIFAVNGVIGSSTIGGLHGATASGGSARFWFNHPFNPANCYDGGNNGCTPIPNPTWFYDISNYSGGAGKLDWDFSPSGAWIMPQTGKFPVLRWQNPNDPIAFPPEFRNGRKVGVSDMAAYRVWGYCGTPGATITFSGPNPPADTTCNGGTWEVSWDFSGVSDGDINITAQQLGDPAVARRLVKDTVSCDGVNQETTATGPGSIQERFDTSSGPHEICNVEQLTRLQSHTANWSKGFILKNNLDLTSYTASPIGDSVTAFTGSFDGDGFVLSNLSMTNAVEFTGLFGRTDSNALLKNLGIESADVRGADSTGILVGQHRSTLPISNSYTTGYVYASRAAPGALYTGGVVGALSGAGVEDVFSSADVVSNGSLVGGVAGEVKPWGAGQGEVRRVSSYGNVWGATYVGGLIGHQQGAITELSFSNAKVAAWGNIAGGAVGKLDDSYFQNIYAKDDVYATGSHVGGLIGAASSSSADIVVMRSYSSGRVIGDQNVGGLMGSITSVGGGSTTVAETFSTGDVNAVSSDSGGLIGNANEHLISNNNFWYNTFQSSKGCVGEANGGNPNCTVFTDSFDPQTLTLMKVWDFSTPVWKYPAKGLLPILNWQHED